VKEKLLTFRIGAFAVVWLVFCVLTLLSPQLRVLRGNSDFLAQYTAGRLLLNHQGSSLYQFDLQEQVQRDVLASLDSDVQFHGGLLPFIHPPFVAWLYLPTAWLPYAAALLLWNVFSFACFATGIVKLVRYYRLCEQPDLERLIALCLVFVPVVATLLQGQNTFVAFLFLVLAFLELKQGFEFRSGIWLSLVLVKFQLLPVPLLMLLLKRRWKALFGFLAGSSVLLLVSLYVVRLEGCWSYLKLLGEMPGWVDRYGINPLKAHCIRGQMFLLFYNRLPGVIPGLTGLLSISVVMLVLRCWKGKWNPGSPLFDLKFALLVIAGLLVAPHVNFHDLALLLLPGLIIFHHTRRGGLLQQSRLRLMLLVVGFPLQLLAFVSSPTVPLQINVIGLSVLGGMVLSALRPGRVSEVGSLVS